MNLCVDAARNCVLVKHAYYILESVDTQVFWPTQENHFHTPHSPASYKDFFQNKDFFNSDINPECNQVILFFKYVLS